MTRERLRRGLAVLVTFAAGCGIRSGARPARSVAAISRSNPTRSAPDPSFVDVVASSGLHYHWTIDGKRPVNILQSIGNGCAFLDYDGDGCLDILLVGPKLALYRGDGHGRFDDVTEPAGLSRLSGHFLGCAVGDYDNDGFDDLYISGYRTGLLFHNEGGRRFRDVTRVAGLAPQPWGSSCTFVDTDGDGRLDLYVGNYVQFGPQTAPQLCNFHGVMTSCGPGQYEGVRGVLYRNLGGGRFVDVTRAWGFDRVSGKCLGVAAAPDADPRSPSLAIANDQQPGDLVRLHGANSQYLGAGSGMAFAADGNVYGGMGIDWGDYDADGRLDLVVATYQGQAKAVFHNDGGRFSVQDVAELGMLSSVPYVAFGAKWVDFDNDGWLDLIFANGHVQDNIADVDLFGGKGAAYRQPTVLYRNVPSSSGRHFEDESDRLDPAALRPVVGRGLAVGDYDNDGRQDVLIADSEGAPLLLHNVSSAPAHWLLVDLRGRKCNRDAYGAVVEAHAGGRTLVRHCHADGSYLSSSDRRVHLGLADSRRVDRLVVRWPDGRVDRYANVPADRVITITEGRSSPAW